MKLLLLLVMVALAAAASENAEAQGTKKVHFTQTVASSDDPGLGHGGDQLAFVLRPNKGTIYDGSMTYAASSPVQPVILHELGADQLRGQPSWTVDGMIHYAISTIGAPATSGSLEFTGAAVALRASGQTFAVTVSVDGWVRGQQTEIALQAVQSAPEPAPFALFRASVPVTVPLHTGLYDGEELLYMVTEASTTEDADEITKWQGRPVAVYEDLVNVTAHLRPNVYAFTDGTVGDGIYGYQHEVFARTPEHEEYAALSSLVNVAWKPGQTSETLESEEAILDAKQAGRIELDETGTVLNTPQILWPDGRMQVRENATSFEGEPYEGGQIIELDEANMTATFIAHRGWGESGQTVYHILVGATPAGPAEKLGVTDAPGLAELDTKLFTDVYMFENGIPSSGPLGFQPAVSAGDARSPLWNILIAEWSRPEAASLLSTIGDIEAAEESDLIIISAARPLNSMHIINAPQIDPFWEPKEE